MYLHYRSVSSLDVRSAVSVVLSMLILRATTNLNI